MNGLEYICIKWNFSQSFLAEMIGVTRQAVSDWFTGKTSLTNKRTVELMDFFGLEENLFGELTPENKRTINDMKVYHHKKGNYEFYLHRIDSRYIVSLINGKPVLTVFNDKGTFLLPDEDTQLNLIETCDEKEEAKPASLNEKFSDVMKTLNDVIDRIRKSVNDDELSVQNRTFRTMHLVNLLRPLVDVTEKISNCKKTNYYEYKVVYQTILEELVAGAGMSFGVIDKGDLPNDVTDNYSYIASESQKAIDHAYSWHVGFADKIASLVTDEVTERCQTIYDNSKYHKEDLVPDIKKM